MYSCLGHLAPEPTYIFAPKDICHIVTTNTVRFVWRIKNILMGLFWMVAGEENPNESVNAQQCYLMR